MSVSSQRKAEELLLIRQDALWQEAFTKLEGLIPLAQNVRMLGYVQKQAQSMFTQLYTELAMMTLQEQSASVNRASQDAERLMRDAANQN